MMHSPCHGVGEQSDCGLELPHRQVEYLSLIHMSAIVADDAQHKLLTEWDATLPMTQIRESRRLYRPKCIADEEK